MIHLGASNHTKDAIVQKYCVDNGIKKVVILTPEKFVFNCSFENKEYIKYDEIIKYVFFYRLLQELDDKTLLVINECLRTQNRHDLTYNCIRQYLNQTPHQIIFQYLPIIDGIEDFMTLFDFDTKSRWKREKFNAELLKERTIVTEGVSVNLNAIDVETSPITKAKYEKERERLFNEMAEELKDPHTIPRNLYLVSGKDKLTKIEADKAYIGRNNRFKIEKMQTYKEDSYDNAPYTVFEFPHNFIDFSDFLSLSRQSDIDVLRADLRVDLYYWNRYQDWIENLNNAYKTLSK